jgi:hypothetical protein
MTKKGPILKMKKRKSKLNDANMMRKIATQLVACVKSYLPAKLVRDF